VLYLKIDKYNSWHCYTALTTSVTYKCDRAFAVFFIIEGVTMTDYQKLSESELQAVIESARKGIKK
jgi:hypothetical protein